MAVVTTNQDLIVTQKYIGPGRLNTEIVGLDISDPIPSKDMYWCGAGDVIRCSVTGVLFYSLKVIDPSTVITNFAVFVQSYPTYAVLLLGADAKPLGVNTNIRAVKRVFVRFSKTASITKLVTAPDTTSATPIECRFISSELKPVLISVSGSVYELEVIV